MESSDGTQTDHLTIDRANGLIPGVALDYPKMRLAITYVGDAPEGHFVNLMVTDEAGETVSSSLYQFSSGDELRTAYAGGHGFTGLHYAYSDGAELQFWCSS